MKIGDFVRLTRYRTPSNIGRIIGIQNNYYVVNRGTRYRTEVYDFGSLLPDNFSDSEKMLWVLENN